MADVKTLTVHGTTYNIKDDTARNNIGTLQSTVSGHTSDISEIEGNVNTLQSTVSGHTDSISSIEGEVNTLQSTVSGHTSSISSIEGEVGTLQSGIESANSSISQLSTSLLNAQDFFKDISTTGKSPIEIAHSPSWTTIRSVKPNLKGGTYLYILNIMAITLTSPSGNITFSLAVDGNNSEQPMTIPLTGTSNNIFVPIIGTFNVEKGQHTISPQVKVEQAGTNGTLMAYTGYQIFIFKISE